MKSLFLLLLAFFATQFCYAQWKYNADSTVSYLLNGKVGIGTNSPGANLDISTSTGTATTIFRLQANNAPAWGKYNITRTDNLNGTGYISFMDGYGASEATWGANNKPAMLLNSGTDAILRLYNASGSEAILFNTNGTSFFNEGSLAIGTNDPKGYMLAVAGSAIATSITVKTVDNWPDYVFRPTYTLPSLPSIKSYIEQNHHLPDMPSEEDVKNKGIDLGEMVKLQTKKIEELTLYLIEKDKELKRQQTELATLKKAFEELRKTETAKH